MEMSDHSGWPWGLSLIVLTMAIHAGRCDDGFRGDEGTGPTGNPRP
jgi:hypothetical protein